MTATLETSETLARESEQATKPTVLMCRPEHFTEFIPTNGITEAAAGLPAAGLMP